MQAVVRAVVVRMVRVVRVTMVLLVHRVVRYVLIRVLAGERVRRVRVRGELGSRWA